MIKKHPCFERESCSKFARLHLPVAPACNIKCNYCQRLFDCANESRPGVTTRVISPAEALERYKNVKNSLPISVAGIAGPGDSLANVEETLKTITLIREFDGNVMFCVSTNGLLLEDYAEELQKAGVTHITVTVNAAKVETAMRIYRYVDYKGRRLTKKDAACLLLQKQKAGIAAAARLGVRIKVNIVYIKGINDTEIPQIVQEVKALGAEITNIMQLIPVKGTLFEDLPLTSRVEINDMRKICEAYLPQMYHCRQCRADAAGFLSVGSREWGIGSRESGIGNRESGVGNRESGIGNRISPYYAAATSNGVIVDKHFGQAEEFWIYKAGADGRAEFVEKRSVERYCGTWEGEDRGGGSGHSCRSGEDKIAAIAKTLEGCKVLFVLRIGEVPRAELAGRGIKVVLSYDYIDNAIAEEIKNAYI